jgi:ABC-type molybdenum transport system ATPase subunit/photorepair protein PhrA
LTANGIVEPVSVASDQTEDIDDATAPTELGEPVVEMLGVKVAYGHKVVLGNWTQNGQEGLHMTIRRGERWGVIGSNGSGKTTLLSLICSDHPQTYSQPVKLFGRSRLPEPGVPGISIFDIQARIGHSSPEVQQHIPRSLSVRRVLENAWSETFLTHPRMSDADRAVVNEALKWFEHELRPGAAAAPEDTHAQDTKWADDVTFGDLPFSAQRVAMFLRATIKKPDLVILDESFGGMDEVVRDKCMLFLQHGTSKAYRWQGNDRRVVDTEGEAEAKVEGLEDRQALLVISHVREEIPGCVREWVCLPEAVTGKPARFGRLDGPLGRDWRRWEEIWGLGEK